MNYPTKEAFELAIIKLFNLPKHVIWCTIHFHANETPTVECKYEIWQDDTPKIVEGQIETMRKKFKISIEEIEEQG